MRKKLNNKGFTVIEILVSFVLVMILILNMFTIIMNYRSKSLLESLRADYLSFKTIVTKDIQTDILEKGLISIEQVEPSSCASDITVCLRLNFEDNTSKNLFVYNKQTVATVRNKYLQYGEQKYRIRDDIPDDSKIGHGKTALDYQTVTIDQSRFLETTEVGRYTVYGIHLSLKYDDFEEDFGIHIVTIPNYVIKFE